MSAKTISRCLLRCVQSLHQLFAVATVSVLFASCTRHSAVWPRLLEAEALLETDPHAAGAMIDSIDATPLTGEDAALYAILKTQADYKLYHPLTSDSLPRLATDYYGTPYRKKYHAAMAWYTLGCYYSEKKDDAGAIESYLRAKDLYPDTLVRYYALCEQNLGKHYLNHLMYLQALQSLFQFKEHPVCASDSGLVAAADYLIGQVYIRQLDYNIAEACFLDVLKNNSCPNDIRWLTLFQQARLLYCQEHDLANSLSYLNNFLLEQRYSSDIGSALALKGDICQDLNILDSAAYYYRISLENTEDMFTHCHACQQLSNVYLKFGRQDSVTFYFARYDSLKDVIHSKTREDDILSIEEAQRDERLRQEERSRVLYTLASTAFFMLLAVVLVRLCHNKRKMPFARYQLEITNSRKNELNALACLDSCGETDTFDGQPECEQSSALALPFLQIAESSEDLLSVVKQERKRRIALHRKQCEESPYFKKLISMSGSIQSRQAKNSMDRNKVVNDLLDRTFEFVWDLRQGNPKLSPADILFCVCRILVLPEEATMFLLECPSHRALITRKSRMKDVMDPVWFEVIFE